MLGELRGWLRSLWSEHRIVALLLGLLLLRLIFQQDQYYTIRDADFFPAEFHIRNGQLLRGGRLIPTLLSYVWGVLSGGHPLLAKKISGIAIMLFALPGVTLLGIRTGLSVRAVAFATALFLANAQVFGLYDAMGPYFLLLALCAWQLIFALEARRNQRHALLIFGVISLIAVLCHRNALMSTGLSLGLIILRREETRIRRAEVATLGLFLVLGAWKVIMATRFDAIQHAHHAAVYENGFFSSIAWGPSPVLRGILEAGLSLLPGWAGARWPPLPYLVAANLVLLTALVLGAANIRREIRWLAALGFAGTVGLTMATEAFAADLFFRPNHATYASFWLPLFVVLLGRFMAERFPAGLGNLLLVALLAVNIWQGDRYRDQAFDFRHYETFVAKQIEGGNLHHRRLVPAFLVNDYARRVPVGSHVRPFIPNERLHNDFTTIQTPEFDLDIITYNELGIPLFRYDKYRRYFEAWAAQRGLMVDCLTFSTFVSCRVRLRGSGDGEGSSNQGAHSAN